LGEDSIHLCHANKQKKEGEAADLAKKKRANVFFGLDHPFFGTTSGITNKQCENKTGKTNLGPTIIYASLKPPPRGERGRGKGNCCEEGRHNILQGEYKKKAQGRRTKGEAPSSGKNQVSGNAEKSLEGLSIGRIWVTMIC